MNAQEEHEKAVWRKAQFETNYRELKENNWLQEYLMQFAEHSRESFINQYASEKVRWIEWGPKYIEWQEKQDLKWVDDAYKRLEEIQQKKLFDLQCLWRAEKIDLPDIRICYDFIYWESHILACPFLDPITEEEYNMYLQYLNSFNFQDKQGWLDQWQDYENIKVADQTGNANRNFPDWYDFHNGRTGLSVYLLLPDTRGQKEEEYISLWREEAHRKIPERQNLIDQGIDPDTGDPLEKRPWLDYHKKGWLKWFVETFEDKLTQEKFKLYGGELKPRWEDYDIEEEIRMLKKSCSIEPITGWYDWREAIRKTADAYRKKKIAEALPQAFEQYRMHVDIGIGFEPPDPAERIKFGSMEFIEGIILRGRELAGEPRDFDF